jgi:hypothetical protein
MRTRSTAGLATVLLLGMALVPGGSASAQARGDPAEELNVRVARLKYGGGGDWYNGPSQIPNWLREFERRTGIATFPEEKIVTLLDENLRAYPFIYMTGHGVVKFTPDERYALRTYLEDGGFLFANDDYGMDASFRAAVREVFPDRPFEEIGDDHPIYHSFYDLPGLPKIHEHDRKLPQAFGVTIEGRLVLYYVYETDIGDGLDDPDVHKDPPDKRELAMKMAVNVLMYAITQNVLM